MYTYQNLLETDVRRTWSVCAGKCLRTWKEQLSRCDCQWAIWSFTWVPWVRFFFCMDWAMGRPPVIPTTPQRCPPEVLVTTTCAMVVRLRPAEGLVIRFGGGDCWWLFLDDANMGEFMSEFLFQMTTVNHSWWCHVTFRNDPISGTWRWVNFGVTQIYQQGQIWKFKMISEDRLTVPLPETNSKSPWKWMVGILSFPFWDGLLSVAFAVSFRGCKLINRSLFFFQVALHVFPK